MNKHAQHNGKIHIDGPVGIVPSPTPASPVIESAIPIFYGPSASTSLTRCEPAFLRSCVPAFLRSSVLDYLVHWVLSFCTSLFVQQSNTTRALEELSIKFWRSRCITCARLNGQSCSLPPPLLTTEGRC